jgi:hypothetical protein
MTLAENYFLALSNEILDVKLGKMFGALCMKTPNGKAAAMFWKDNLVVKLGDDAHSEALSLDGAKLFEPMEGRPMKGWVQIPFDYKSKWKLFAEISAGNAKVLKAKNPKKKNK